MSLVEELRSVVRGEVDDSDAARESYSRDASLFRVKPEVIVRVKDAKDVEAVVRLVLAKKKENPKAHISVTPRAAGTDMSGGPLSNSIILDTTTHFNRLLEVAHEQAIVEPGMFFRDFDTETKKQGLELPSYTASRELNTVGGMVGNNSGGEKNLKYGKTARYVTGVEAVLGDGQTHVLENLSGEALQKKLSEQSWEGELYRNIAKLIASHTEIIEHHKPKVEKNSSGYALWDMGDGVTSLNLSRLLVGSQGTLGVVTKIKFNLVRPEPFSAMTIMFVHQLAQLGELVPEVLRYGPDSFESYDDHTFSIAMKYLPELAGQMKAGMISLGISFLPELWMVVTGGVPKLVLLAEFRGQTQAEALAKAQKLAAEVGEKNKGVSVRVAKSEQEARKYWAVRRESFNLLRKKVRGKRTAPFIDDFVVPPATLSEFLPKLEKILAEYPTLTYTIAGHVGDGNFHIIPLVDPKDPTTAKIIDELSHRAYDLVLQYGGSISGEHNDGLIRTPYVEKMFGKEMYGLFLDVKQYFDPLNIFNPGKKVGLTFSDALAKLDLPVGEVKK